MQLPPALRRAWTYGILPAVLLALIAIPSHETRKSDAVPGVSGLTRSLLQTNNSSVSPLTRASVLGSGHGVVRSSEGFHGRPNKRSDAASPESGSEAGRHSGEGTDLDEHSPSEGEKASEASSEVSSSLSALQISALGTKGRTLLQWISETAEQATAGMRHAGKITGDETSQSKWADYEKLRENGWEDVTEAQGMKPLTLSVEKDLVPASDALEGIGVSSEVGGDKAPNRDVLMKHVHGEEPHEGTAAEYNAVYNPIDGVIIAYSSESPQYARTNEGHGHDKDATPPAVPSLSRWSDVVFLEYKHQAQIREQRIENLRYILRLKSYNEVANPLIKQALASRGLHDLPLWEHRQTFTMQEAWGQAILGSPNGEIKSVVVYFDAASVRDATADPTEEALPSMLFELEDVQEAGEGSSSGAAGGLGGAKGHKKRPSKGRYDFRARPQARSGR